MISVSKRMRNAQKTLQAVPRPAEKEKWALPEVVIAERPMPFDMRVLAWIDYQIRTPRRIVRFLTMVFRSHISFYMKAKLLLSAITGPRVLQERYVERQTACQACRQMDDRGYCRSCGCGRWPLARLDRKNWFERWSCPQRRHAGTYVQYTWPGHKQGCGAASRGDGVNSGAGLTFNDTRKKENDG